MSDISHTKTYVPLRVWRYDSKITINDSKTPFIIQIFENEIWSSSETPATLRVNIEYLCIYSCGQLIRNIVLPFLYFITILCSIKITVSLAVYQKCYLLICRDNIICTLLTAYYATKLG